MAKLIWDEVGKRVMEAGVKQGVLYVRDNAGAYPLGVPWNGLTNVTDSPTGGEPTPMYADDIKYLELLSVEEHAGSIECYTYPVEFEECDGQNTALATGLSIGQQSRKTFGMAYVTTLVNDTEGYDYGYKIHLVYGALATPSEKSHDTINDTPEGVTLSYDFTTTKVAVTGAKPTAKLVIDSRTIAAAKLTALEDIIFGDATNDARLPLPDEIITLINAA